MNPKALAPVALLAVLAAGCAAGTSSNDGASADAMDLTATSGDPRGSGSLEGETDAAIKTELEAVTKDLTYTSESDYPWTYVTAKGAAGAAPGELSVDDVRKLFASYVDGDPDADKPLAKLAFETRTFEEWTAGDFTDCDANNAGRAAACLQTQKMDTALEQNLTDLKVYLFGESGSDGVVEGTAVSIFIVGRTPAGNWAGVRTIAIWT